MKAQDWDERWRLRLEGPLRHPNRFLVEEVEALPPGRALDLACGAGRNAVWLAEQGWRVTGVDYSAVALTAARALAAERGVEGEWIEADVVAWEPPAAAFDLVCVLYLQLPAPDRRAVHAHAVRALAPGGRLLVVAHHRDNLTEGYGGPKSPAVLFSEDEVAADLAGLEVERAARAERPVVDEEGEHVAIDAVVLARRPGG
jgi:SAM-dependent methyltransferase